MNIIEKIENLRSQIYQIDDEMGMQVRTLNEETTKQLQGLFNVDNSLQVKYSSETLRFYSETLSKLDESNGSRSLFDIYFKRDFYLDRDENNTLQDLELSYYTTSCRSEFELRRVYYLGLVAEIVRTRKEDILKLVNQYENDKEYVFMRAEKLKRKWMLEKEMRDLQKEVDQAKVQDLLDRLTTTGIEFKEYGVISLKQNFTVHVHALKIDNISSSRKTCTVSYTYRATYEGASSYTMKEERVSLSNLLHQLSYMQDKIK